MSEPAPSLAPIGSSPLKVRKKNRILTADDPSGATVVRGTPGQDVAAVLETAGGTWRIQSRVDDVRQVYDRNGLTVATLRHKTMRGTDVELPSGESIHVTTGNLQLFGIGCKVGDLASARAPFLAPQRYFKLALNDALLGRADRDLLVALSAYLTEIVVSAQVSAQN